MEQEVLILSKNGVPNDSFALTPHSLIFRFFEIIIHIPFGSAVYFLVFYYYL